MDYLLIDVDNNHSYDFLASMSEHPLNVVFPPRCSGKKEVQWLFGIFKVLRKSRTGDRILFVFDFQAVLAWWICRLTGIRRTFICINLMLDQKDTFRNRFVSSMYRKALLSDHFKATVTSKEYGLWLNGRLGIEVPHVVLRDVFHPDCQSEPDGRPFDVFCGGRNGRDWDFIFDLSASMPDVSFTIVVPPQLLDRLSAKKNKNVRIFSNLSEAAFLQCIADSKVVCLPLVKQAPCGLIVMFQAAANRKPVITSDTVTTRAYCSDGRGILLPQSLSQWQEAVRSCLMDSVVAEAMVEKMLSFCETECSESTYVRTIDVLLDRLI